MALTNPRGFAWDAGGTLYLGLAGSGGPRVAQAAGTPTGFTGGETASVVRFTGGCPETVVTGLPSSQLTAFGWVWGVMDVAFLDGRLYLLEGGGAIHGNPDHPNGIYRVETDGTVSLVANLGAWVDANPVANLPPEGFPNEGSFFGLEAGTDALYVTDAVNGQILRVTPAGKITRVVDLSAGHMVPTGIALAPDGAIYVGYETAIPYKEGSSKVSRVAPDGTVTDAWTGLTAVSDVVLGPDGALYAAELATSTTDKAPYFQPGTGRIVRQTGPNSQAVVVDGIDAPVMLGFGPDGALYVTLPAFGANHGEGMLARVTAGGEPGTAVPAACPPQGSPTA